MVIEAIKLPFRAAEAVCRQTWRAASRALDLAGEVVPIPGRDGHAQTGAGPPATADPRTATQPPAPWPDREPAIDYEAWADREPAVDYDAVPELQPLHVETEVEVVAERADPDATDGAGAQLKIDEPWPGYDNLHADEIIAAIATAGPAELAVTDLYENTHKRRRTVLAAVEQQLRASRGSGAGQ